MHSGSSLKLLFLEPLFTFSKITEDSKNFLSMGKVNQLTLLQINTEFFKICVNSFKIAITNYYMLLWRIYFCGKKRLFSQTESDKSSIHFFTFLEVSSMSGFYWRQLASHISSSFNLSYMLLTLKDLKEIHPTHWYVVKKKEEYFGSLIWK